MLKMEEENAGSGRRSCSSIDPKNSSFKPVESDQFQIGPRKCIHLEMTGTRLVGLLSLGKRLDKAHMWATLGARFVQFAPRHGLYLYRAFMLAGLC